MYLVYTLKYVGVKGAVMSTIFKQIKIAGM